MCMTFYIGSNVPLVKINFDKNSPSFHTMELSQEEQLVTGHFSSSNVLYMGSDLGCGCGFKHSLLEKAGLWYDVVDENDEDVKSTLINHQNLIKYLTSILQKKEKIEIYACWDGNHVQKPQWLEKLTPADLENENFYFKENGFYTITNKTS